MFRSADNLKQAIAVATILLSFSTLAQHSGLYCRLGACGTRSVANTSEVSACCHNHACQAEERPSPATQSVGEHRHDSCPCPDSCWCHQSPQPVEPPRSFDEPFELAFSGAFAICEDVIAGGIADQRALVTWSLPLHSEEESAVCRCAKFCRFLI